MMKALQPLTYAVCFTQIVLLSRSSYEGCVDQEQFNIGKLKNNSGDLLDWRYCTY